jgi:hypothetical protein
MQFAHNAQSRQSAKLFIQLSELGLLQPLTRRRVCPPPSLVPGGGAHSPARERVGESQLRRGDIHCETLYIYMYFVAICNSDSILSSKQQKEKRNGNLKSHKNLNKVHYLYFFILCTCNLSCNLSRTCSQYVNRSAMTVPEGFSLHRTYIIFRTLGKLFW